MTTDWTNSDNKTFVEVDRLEFRIAALANSPGLASQPLPAGSSHLVYCLVFRFRLAFDWRFSLHVQCLQRAGTLLLEGAQPLAAAVLVDREHQPRTSFVHNHGEVGSWTASAPDGTDGKWSGRREGVSPCGVRCGRSSHDRNGGVLIRRARYKGRERIADLYRRGGPAGPGRENKRRKRSLPDEIKLPAHVPGGQAAVAAVGLRPEAVAVVEVRSVRRYGPLRNHDSRALGEVIHLKDKGGS